MLQRFEARAARLAVRDAVVGPAEAAVCPGAGSVMRLADGDIAADLKPIATNRSIRKRSTTYELLVSNDTAAPLATFAYAPDAGSRGRLTWNAIVVPPFSAIAVEFDVALGRRRVPPRVTAELFADEAQLTLDAPPPQPDIPAYARRGAAIGAAALAMAFGLTAFAQLRPHIVALAAPATVRGGAPFTVAYALGAGHRARYVVETPEGQQIRRGTLDGRTGAFTIALPVGRASAGYDVRVTTSGRLGSDERTAHVVALPAKSGLRHRRAVLPGGPSAASVADLALERDTVRGGEAIVATYRASNTTGIVRLIDALGTVRAEALLTPRGRSILVAPTVEADQDFRVVATVEHGTTRAEAATPVTVLHGASARAAAAALPADGAVSGGTEMAAAGVRVPRGSAPIAVDPVQHPARPIVVRVDRYHPGLHVALMGDSTDELAGSDVAPGDASVVLRPPQQLADARYAIVATYATGLGQETLIRPITFRAP